MADYLFRNMLRSRLSRSNFWQFFSFIFFLKRAESHSAGLKVFYCYSLFYTSSFWFPEALPTCTMRGRWFFPLFLLGRLALEKDMASPLFLVFLFCLFLSNCLNLLLTVLTRLGGSRAFWQSLRIPAQLSSSILWHGLFSFSFFFSHKLLGFPFFLLDAFWASNFLGLPFLLLFRGPLALISLVLGTVTFLDLNRVYNMSISLNSFRTGANCWKVWLKGVKPHFGPIRSTVNVTLSYL